MANAISYIKNVGKSVAYVSVDVAKSMVPVFNEFAETNGELATDMYKAIKNIKKTAKDTPSQVMNSKYGKFAKSYLDNLNSDLKSGNFYNRERIAKANDAMMESFGGDIDFDFGSDDSDFNFGSMDDSFGDDDISTNEMIDIVGEKSSNAISNAMARSAEYIVEGTTESNKAIYNQMNNIYGGLHTSLATINQNISKIIEFSGEATTTHYENSRTFYTEITRLDQERNAMLKEILETVKKIETPQANEKSKSTSNRYSDLVSYNGVLDISKYKNVIKKNINDKTGGVFDMINVMFDMGLDKEIAASPVSGLMKMAMTAMIPYTLQKSLDSLNKSISGIVGSVLMNLKEKSRKDGGIWDTISEIFGIDTSLKTSLNTSDYEKGKVPFDGITRKAIIEVIPTYLAKIYSAVSGQKETRFNYESGKFVTMDQLKEEFDGLKKSSADRAAYELDHIVRSNKGKLKFRNEADQRQFEEDWEAIKLYMFENQRGFNTRDKNLSGKSFGLKGGLASDKNVRALQKLFDGRPEMLALAGNLYREIDSHNSRMREYESSGTMTALANGSDSRNEKSAFAAIAGEANRSALSELVAIHKELSYIRMYGFGGGKGKGGKRPSFDKFNIPNARTVDSKSYDKAQSDRVKSQNENIPEYDVDDEVSRLFSGMDEESPTKKATKTFSQRMHEAAGLTAKMSVLASSATELAKKPAAFIVSMLDKADERLYDLIYGPKGDKNGDKSFIGRLFTGLENTFNKFSDFMTDKILEPLKEKFTGEKIKNFFKDAFEKIFNKSFDDVFSGVKEKLFGTKDSEGNRTKSGLFGDFMDGFKSEMKGAFGWVKNIFGEFGDWIGATSKFNSKGEAKQARNDQRQGTVDLLGGIINNIKNNMSNITEAASGLRRVDSTGLAVISEGEMILPPDMNPFNISKRRRNERKVKSKLKSGIDSLFEFNKGSLNVGDDNQFTDEDMDFLLQYISTKEGMADMMSSTNPKDIELLNATLEREKNRKEKFTDEDYERKPYHARMFDDGLKGAENLFNHISDFVGDNKDTDKFKDNAMNFINKFKEHGASMAAGATIGAGVSVLTGLIGGPLVGAAVGAGAGLLAKSETLQEMLFGKIKDGEREGGLIPKDITKNINKYFPDMGKGATVGGILAALPFVPGGPVAGIIVGSALGFAKNNDTVQKALFGDSEEGGFLGTKEQFQDKVRSLLPKMGAGALAGLVAGPFGVTTNILLGSALGFATDTDAFKDVMFGKEENGVRSGGIFGAVAEPLKKFVKDTTNDFNEFLKDRIFKPLENAVAPFKKQFEIMGKSITDKLSKMFEKSIGAPLERALKEHVIDPMGKFFGKLFGGLMKPIKAIISAPFRLIGGIGDGLRKRQIKSGNADYMTAEQRMDFRRSKGAKMGLNDQYLDFDESLLKMGKNDPNRLVSIYNALGQVKESDTELRNADLAAFDNIKKGLYKDNNIDIGISKDALKLIKRGEYQEAIDFINSRNISEGSKKSALDLIAAESAKIKDIERTQAKAGASKDELLKQIEDMGLSLTPEMRKELSSGKGIDKVRDLINAELKAKGIDPNAKNDESESADNVDQLNKDESKRHDETIDKLDEIIKTILSLSKRDDEGTAAREAAQAAIYRGEEGLADPALLQDEKHTIGGKLISAKHDIKESISEKVDESKQIFDKTVIKAKANARVLRHSGIGNQLLGDKNEDWNDFESYTRSDGILTQSKQDEIKNRVASRLAASRTRRGQTTPDSMVSDLSKSMKTVAAATAAMAHSEGLDVGGIDTNKSLDVITSSVKNKISKAKNTVTQFVNGLPLKFKRDKNGDLVEAQSAENKDTHKALDEQQSTQKGILAGITGLSTSVGGFFKNFFGKKKDDEDNIFTKIWKFLTGEDSNFNLKNILINALPLALTAFGLGGMFDNIANKISGGAFGSSGSNDGITVTDEGGNNVQIQTDENGNPIKDKDGNYITIDGKPVSGDSYLQNTGAVSTMSLSDRLKYNTARNTITGKGSIVGATLKSNKLTKGITNKASTLKGKASSTSQKIINASGDDIASLQSRAGIVNDVADKVRSWGGAIKKVPMLSKYADKIDNLVNAVIKITANAIPAAGKSLAKISASLAKAAPWVLAATVVVDFTTGWQDASTILKIKAENVTLPQKIICGLVRTVKNFIPIIGTFIPDQMVTDLFIDHVAGWFNMDVSALKSQRDEAQAELDEYNAAHGTNYSWAEYNKKILGNYTWTESVGNAVSSVVTNIKDKGLGKTISSGVSHAVESIKDSKVGQWVSNTASSVSDLASKAFKFAADGAKDLGNKFTGNAFNDDEIRKRFGLSDDQEITIQDRISVFLGSKLSPIFGKDVTKEIDGTITRIKNGISDGLDIVNKNLGAHFGFVDSEGNPLSLTDGLSYSWDGMKDGVKQAWTEFTDGAKQLAKDAAKGFNDIKTEASKALDIVNKNLGAHFGFVDSEGNPLSLTDGLSYSWDGMKDGVKQAWTEFTDGAKQLANGISDEFNKFKKAASEAMKIVDKNLGAFFGFVDSEGNPLSLTDGLSYSWDGMKDGVKQAWDDVKDIGKNIKDSISKFFQESAEVSEAEHTARGSGIAGRGSNVSADTFISQLDPRYANKRFNIASDSEVQTLGNSGCAPAAAAMAINATMKGSTTMEEASKNALKYKVRNDGVNATYFNDEFARHGISAKYITSNDKSVRQQEIARQLMSNNKVVLMGSDPTNSSKEHSPFGPNPHYVVANGMSEDGKYVYINDPESNRANIKYSANKVFGNTTLGIAANVARGTRVISNKIRKYVGRGTYGTDSIEYKVWSRLREAGYSEVQVAGIMGNIKHESGFDTAKIEKGSGIGFGLIQWSYGRRTQFENYASSIGKSASDLDTQIDFLLAEMTPGGGANGYADYQFMKTTYEGKSWPKDTFDKATDITTATKAFCYCFERPKESTSHIDRRITSANDYYEAFTGKTAPATYVSSNSYTGTTTNGTTSSGGNIISDIYGVFSNLAAAYGLTSGNTSTDSTGGYTAGTLDAGTYSTSGNVVSDQTLAAKQRALVEKMYSVQGTLKYAQDNSKYPGSRNPDDGSGDCSSTVQWAYQKVLGVDPGSNTTYQRDDSDTYTVAYNTNDESKLQLGDLLLKNGHVEMYAGDGKMIGHGGGQDGKTLGPTVKDLDKSGKYNLVRRWVGFQGKGSGIPDNGAYNNALRHIKPNQFNTLLPMGYDQESIEKDKISVMQFNSNKLSDNTVRDKAGKPVVYTGRASNVVVNTQPTKSNDALLQLVKSIVQLLVQIVSNTDQLNGITKLLGEYITAVSSTDGSKESKEMAVLAKQNLINALQSGNNNSSSPNAQLMRLIESTEQIASQ